jgi:sarcosine/dimethylglycine N-methyltransferase
MTYAETDLLASMERLTGSEGGDGQSIAALTQDQRDWLDQFHAGGPDAVDRLLPSLHLEPGMTVLDVGSGLGGPARQIARRTGCSVVGVDITPAYVDAAKGLTAAAGLAEQVRFVCSDIATFDRTKVDAAYTMHVQMNVADKKAYFTDIARHLRPGARFATFEVCLVGEALPHLPLPWSLDGTDSYLVTADELRDTISSSGFETLEWVDETAWVRQWFDDLGKRIAAGGNPAGLPALLTEGPTRMTNLAVALATGVVSVQRGSFILAT